MPRGSSVPAENTDGMVVTQLAVNGEDVNLTAPPPARGGGAGGARRRRRPPAQPSTVTGLDQTLARIMLGTPVAREADAQRSRSSGAQAAGRHRRPAATA